MSENTPELTTRQFSSLTGLSVPVITRLLRQGRIQGVKASGKWMIPENQLHAEAVAQKGRSAPAGPRPRKSVPSKPKRRAFSVREFAAMTYLTETGIDRWLKSGRLEGHKGENGEWAVDAANLENPDIKRLIRK
jgi:hypothetical protein